jgi:hypothetical protein
LALKKCRQCGFPIRFGRFFDWRSDGTIIGTDRLQMQSQITFLENGEMEGLFEELSIVLGMPIDHILIEAEKNVGTEFYADTPLRFLKYAPKNRYFRPAIAAKMGVRAVRADVAGLGSGIISADFYRGGTSMVMRFRNPVFTARSVGNTLGIYESIEGIRGTEYEYGMEDGELLVWMRHPSSPQEPLSETRLFLEEVRPGEGPLSYERCAACNTPLAASRAFDFNVKEGIITNRNTGKRELVGAVQSVSAMLRELEAELSEDVLVPLFGCQKEIARAQIEAEMDTGGDDFWERCLVGFALRGLGYPDSFEQEGGSITVSIRNAYNPTLYAARVAAAYECSTGLIADIEWTSRDRYDASFTISKQAT